MISAAADEMITVHHQKQILRRCGPHLFIGEDWIERRGILICYPSEPSLDYLARPTLPNIVV